METVYMPRKNHSNVTDIINFRKYFDEFYRTFENIKNKKKGLKDFIDCSNGDEKLQFLKGKFCILNYTWKKAPGVPEKLVVPVSGFKKDFKLYEIPKDADLKSVQALRSRLAKEESKRRRLLRYTGEVNCDNVLPVEDDKYKEKIKEYSDYLLTVRIYLPTVYCSFANAKKTKPLQISQEFYVYGRETLVNLRDRILCSEDYCSPEGDVSTNPFTVATVRNMDIYKSAMFFINDKFFIDTRYPTNIDYSEVVKKWAERKNLNLKVTLPMEKSTFDSVEFRLGYPYLYMHQGNCEHLIVFTDARLITPRDILVKLAYPIMRSYANLRGKLCMICTKRPAKFIVLNTDRLPLSRTYVCGLCLYQYFYIDGKKTDDFMVYKFLDRVALL